MNKVNQSNAVYWDEPCGATRLAQLGAPSLESLEPSTFAIFDSFFFQFYPYLEGIIPFQEMQGKAVLEVGLGMGAVAEKIVRAGALFTGLDIAEGPVSVVNARLDRSGLSGRAQVGDVLRAPFGDESFDFVISIGCLHHTGDLPRALSEVHRVLKKGGVAIVMLYYAYSPKRWLLWPRATWRHLKSSRKNPAVAINASASERAGYDRSTSGVAPPETTFTSKKQMREFAEGFSEASIALENLDTDMLLYPLPPAARPPFRRWLLRFGKWLGVATEDMYVTLRR